MHSLLAGIMGFFMGITSFFHGGQSTQPPTNQPQIVQQSTNADTATPSGTMKHGFGKNMQLPAGEKPFFGIVTNVNGSTLTVQMQRGMRPMGPNSNGASPSPATSQTVTITLTSSTQYTGGSQSDIATNTRIAGIGNTNSDGSITAVKIQINPTMPSGFPMHRGGPMGGPPNAPANP